MPVPFLKGKLSYIWWCISGRDCVYSRVYDSKNKDVTKWIQAEPVGVRDLYLVYDCAFECKDNAKWNYKANRIRGTYNRHQVEGMVRNGEMHYRLQGMQEAEHQPFKMKLQDS